MLLKRFSVTELIFLALLVLIIVAMLVTALVVGLHPPDTSEPTAPYEMESITPEAEAQGRTFSMKGLAYDSV